MGLYWTPATRAKPGHEKEHAQLLRQLGCNGCSVRDSIQNRLHAISTSAAETIRGDHQHHPPREFEEVGAGGTFHRFNGRAMGSFVDRDGEPWFYDLESGQQVEMMSFHANALGQHIPVINARIWKKAKQNKSAPELLKFADEMERALQTYCWNLRKYFPVLSGREVDLMTAENAQFVRRAIAWCRFWGTRGHGMATDC